jgi:transposase-like protein
MSSVIDLEGRRQLWLDVLAATGSLRSAKVAQLGVFILGELGTAVDLYHDHDEAFQRTFLTLDAADMLAPLLEPYLLVDTGDADTGMHAEDFLALVTARLARLHRTGSAPENAAGELFRFWRRALYDRSDRDADSLTIAEVAALYGITPQAVYKWVRGGKVAADKGPDGKLRIPAASLRTTREQERAIDGVRAELRATRDR